MDNKIKYARSNFVSDTSSGTMFGMLNISTSTQRDLEHLEDQARVKIQNISDVARGRKEISGLGLYLRTGLEMSVQVLLKKDQSVCPVDAEFYTSHQTAFMVSKAKDKPTFSRRSVANRFKQITVLYAEGSNTEHFAVLHTTYI